MTLTARAVNALEGDTPRVYPTKYASTLAPQLIPNYEDRSLNETVAGPRDGRQLDGDRRCGMRTS